jgi:hypothetical protein
MSRVRVATFDGPGAPPVILPQGIAMLDRARARYPWYDMQTLYPFTEQGVSEAIAAAMAIRTVKSTIIPFEGLD